MFSKRKQSKLKEIQQQKQKIKMTLVIISAASLVGMIAGFFIYLNFSQSQKSKAQNMHTNETEMLPVDFYQASMVQKDADMRLKGVRYKVAKQLPGGQKTVLN